MTGEQLAWKKMQDEGARKQLVRVLIDNLGRLHASFQVMSPRSTHPTQVIPPSQRIQLSALRLRFHPRRKSRRSPDYFTAMHTIVPGDRLRVGWLNGFSFVTSWDLSGRGTTRAEDAQVTPTQSRVSPSILVYEEKLNTKKTGHDCIRRQMD